MHLLLPLLLLEVAGQLATSSIDREIEEIRSDIPGDAACANPSEDDMRPYTLCLAETSFNDAEAEMDRQLKVTLAHVEAIRGARAADRLADEQLKWAKRRDGKCEKEMADSPVTQVARNTLGCQTIWTEQRTAQLAGLAGPAPELVAAEITIPSRIEERMADFRRSMLDSGTRGRLTDCRMIMEVTQGLINSNHSYGAICMVKPAGTTREVFVCNDEIVGHFAIAPATAASRDAVVAFVKSKCVGG